VENRTGNLGDNITISRDEGKIVVVANGAKFSGRYLKYLTKKFLKKNNVFFL
jgi:large subunit ribosomal protein L22e